MMGSWSGECQVNPNLSLTLLDVKLVIGIFYADPVQLTGEGDYNLNSIKR